MNAVITGTGAYVPPNVVTNDALATVVDTSDEWIRARTGIAERRIAAASEKCSDLAERAARAAIENSGVAPEEIGLLVVATITADTRTPSTACWIQPRLGLRNAVAFDISAACSGFIYALDIARRYIQTGAVKHALVVGADKMSDIVDWSDRGTCVIFGDGAGAVVLSECGTDIPVCESRGIISTVMGADGDGASLIHMKAPAPGTDGYALTFGENGALSVAPGRGDILKMEGNKVFVSAVRGMSEVAFKALEAAGLTLADIALVIPHQANTRIIDSIADKMGIPHEKLCVNIDRVGNTTAASIPLALDEALRDGRVRDGDNILLVAFGAGLTWGATVLRWGR
ncbi:MAG: ketoacyl-ACP synthase III [Kiritimatiellaeota bacterium]|nr:ketoacyl-ACP synthase III [Kiritimatiellota bacterium]